MRFEVLGPLRVRQDGETLTLGGPKPRALLGMLLLHAGEPVGIDHLTEALWDAEPPASAPVNLRAYVRTLRRVLGPGPGGDDDNRLETKAPGYLIRVGPGELDLADFEDLDARGRQALERGETETAVRLWREALDLWRDDALADVRGGPRLAAAVVRLGERRLRVVEAWIDAQLALGAHAELVSELRGLVAAEPLHEPLWARLIVALHRSGRTADALAAFGQARQHLTDELGVEPSRQLQRLQRAILAGDAVVHVDGMRRDVPAQTPVDVSERPPPASEECPYQGLMPFEAADADRYFGRERLVAELITYLSSQLTPPSLLAVVGPSGSGKSSLLRAGLLPALGDGLLPPARDWPAVVLTPGAQPLAALCDAVAHVQPPGAQAPEPDDLTDPRRLTELLEAALSTQATGRRLVMVVDQLEELFTVCREERDRQAFVAALCVAAGGGQPAGAAPAVVIFGLRADFYSHCIGYPELVAVLSGSQVVVGPMTEAELRHAIERPAARYGLTLEPGLVEMLLADIGLDPESGGRPEPGGLPLLSHALLTTWQLRDGQRLTVAGYRKAGGMQGAIAATAEDVYDHLAPAKQSLARQLFTRLVAFGEATQDTSRRIRHDELLDGRSQAETAAIGEVLDTLAQARLIVLGSNTIQIAHEALIARWPRLQEWLTEDREGLRIHRQLTEAAYAWAALARDPGALYRGARLAAARQWAEQGRAHHGADLNALERAFLDASLELEAAEGAAERRRSTRSRQLAVALLVLLLLAVAGGMVALWQAWRNAEHERVNRSQELARTALGLPIERRPAAMLLAAEAFRTAPTAQARGALAALAPENGYLGTLTPAGGWISAVAYSPDGDLLAAGSDDGTITLWDPRVRASASEPAGGDLRVRASASEPAGGDSRGRNEDGTLTAPDEADTLTIAFSPDGHLLTSGHADGTIVMWDLGDRRRVGTLEAGGGPVRTLTFSPDGSVLASGHDDGALVLWDAAERTRLATLDAGAPPAQADADDVTLSDHVTSVAFSPDGTMLASGSNGGALVLWDAAERTRLATLADDRRDSSGQREPVDAVAFSPDGTALAVVQSTPVSDDPDGAVRPVALWDVPSRAVSATLGPAFTTVFSLAFSPDGETLAMGAVDGVELWDLSDSPDAVARTRVFDPGGVGTMAFSPDGNTLAVEDRGRAVTLLDRSSPQVISDGFIHRLAFSDDGTHLATSGDSAHVDLWDAAAREHLAAFDSPGYPYGEVAFSPSGEWLGRAGWQAVVLYHVPLEEDRQLWKLRDRPDDTWIPAAGGPRSIGFSADPSRVFVADSYHEMVLVWPPGELPVEKPIPGLRSAAISPDHDMLATATTSAVTLWTFPDMTQPQEIGPFERFDAEPLVTFSDDGTTLGTVDRDVVTLWDVTERAPITSLTEDVPATDIAIAPDNRTVALALDDPGVHDRVTVWDAVDGVRIADLPLGSSIGSEVAFHARGTVVAATDGDTVRFWDLDPDRATASICATLDRSLTQEEWSEFRLDEPHRATCDS